MSSVGWQISLFSRQRMMLFWPIFKVQWILKIGQKKHGCPFFSRLQVSWNHRPGTIIACITPSVFGGQSSTKAGLRDWESAHGFGTSRLWTWIGDISREASRVPLDGKISLFSRQRMMLFWPIFKVQWILKIGQKKARLPFF